VPDNVPLGSYFAVPGTANTGGGGGGRGGGGANNSVQGAGGSGIIVIRYANTYDNMASTTGSPTFVNTGGFKYYYFNGTGSFTV
jgi:hypothetical protein